MIAATDPNLYSYKGPPGPDERHPSPEVMRQLVELYIQYMHPVNRLVDDRHPDFWVRLDRPMEPEVALIVYAMCTVGALFLSKGSSTGYLDGLVYEFYRRAWAIKDQQPNDIVMIQTYLIMEPFFIIASQTNEGANAHLHAAKLAEKIKLGEQVQKLSSQGRLTAADRVIRNTWRSVIWMEVLVNLTTMQTTKHDHYSHPPPDASTRPSYGHLDPGFLCVLAQVLT
ncbi:hypothetical protein BGZ83_010543 [Gryganskiella cystojenkinii]|nr:hypothetical protein BGZ83_010543 [Gryganskiella cystojenkinii]